MGKTYAVLGLGTFGYQMAVSLRKGGGEVLVVDLQEAVVNRISPEVTRAVCADITDEQVLKSLGVYDADAVIIGVPDHFDVAVLVEFGQGCYEAFRQFMHAGRLPSLDPGMRPVRRGHRLVRRYWPHRRAPRPRTRRGRGRRSPHPRSA